MSKKCMEFLGVVCGILKLAGPVMMFIGFFWMIGIAGISDFESEIGEILHPFSWYLVQIIKASAFTAVGYILDKYMVSFYRWIRRTNRRYIINRYQELTERRFR